MIADEGCSSSTGLAPLALQPAQPRQPVPHPAWAIRPAPKPVFGWWVSEPQPATSCQATAGLPSQHDDEDDTPAIHQKAPELLMPARTKQTPHSIDMNKEARNGLPTLLKLVKA